MCTLTVAPSMWTKSFCIITQHWDSTQRIWGALCPRRHTSLNPSRAIDPAHLHSVGILYSLRLPANCPLCISSFFLHSPQDIKATLSCRARTKEAASAQRNPLKYKNHWAVCRQAGGQTESHEVNIINVLKKPCLITFIQSWGIFCKCILFCI